MKTSVFCGAMMKPINDIFGNQIKIMLITRHMKPNLTSFARVRKDNEMRKRDLEDTKQFWYNCISLPYTEKYTSIQRLLDLNKVDILQVP